MALPDLIARLERDAEARTAGLEAAAQAEADALQAEALRLTAQRRDRELVTRRLRRRTRLEAELAEARRRARGERLAAQHALLARILDRARALVPEVAAGEAYRAQLPLHFAEARRYLERLPVVVRCHPSVAALLRASADAQVAFTEEPTMAPGLVMSASDGSVFIDNTLPARLQRLEGRLAVELLATLARSPGAGGGP